ncbi:replication protein RepA [Rhizobium beringeri]
MPDTSIVKDADLRKRLRDASRFKLPAVREVEVRQIIAEQVARNAESTAREVELSAMPREKRRRALTHDHFLQEHPRPADIRHLHSVLAICGLPYKRPPIDLRDFRRKQGNMGIMVQAGTSLGPDGAWLEHTLPFGPKARLILIHLCSGSHPPEIADGRNRRHFHGLRTRNGPLRQWGKKGPLTACKEQLNALAHCSIRISSTEPNKMKANQFFLIEDIDMWLSTDSHPESRWRSTVTFSSVMFENLKVHALPVNLHVASALQGSARKLDIYFWLGWRMYNISAPLTISWGPLTEQFGSGVQPSARFQGQVHRRDYTHQGTVAGGPV